MMRWFGPKPIAWTEADVRAVAQRVHGDLEKQLGDEIFVARDGLVTKTQLVAELKQVLENTESQTTPELLAVQTGVDRPVVQNALAELAKSLEFYNGNTHTLPVPLVRKLQSRIKSAAVSFPTQIEVCKTNGITIKELTWLVSNQPSTALVADLVVDSEKLEARRNAFKHELAAATDQIDLTKLEPRADLRDLFLASAVAGRVDAKTGLFTPESLVERRQAEAEAELKANGYITVAALVSKDIKNATKFARKSGAQVLGANVVADWFIAQTVHTVQTELTQSGLYPFFDLPLDGAFRGSLAALKKYESPGISGYYISKKLESDILELFNQHNRKKARQDVAQLVSTAPPKPGMDVLKYVAALKSLSPVELRRILHDHGNVESSALADELAAKFAQDTRKVYITESRTAAEAAVNDATKAQDLKISVYLNGLLEFEDPLRGLLFDDWVQYVTDTNGYSLNSIKQAQDQYPARFKAEELESTAANLLQVQRRKLEKTTDPALVLHLAIVVWYSTHTLGGTGMLRFGGKLVPKVLKGATFPPEFSELKTAIMAKSKDREKLAALVKDVTAVALAK